jgi:hypothetical protein
MPTLCATVLTAATITIVGLIVFAPLSLAGVGLAQAVLVLLWVASMCAMCTRYLVRRVNQHMDHTLRKILKQVCAHNEHMAEDVAKTMHAAALAEAVDQHQRKVRPLR